MKFWVFVIAISSLAACGPGGARSKLEIVGGSAINESELAAVVAIQGCTGTFVGADTLITAGHCVANGTSYKAFRLRKIITHRQFAPVSGTDLAVVVFAARAAPATMPLAARAPLPGSLVTLVGFGCNALGGLDFGTKRRGANRITDFTGGVIHYRRDLVNGLEAQPGQEALTCAGDSGSPMIFGGAVIGVAGGVSGDQGIQADATSAAAKAFFRQAAAQGATIPGVSPDLGASDLVSVVNY